MEVPEVPQDIVHPEVRAHVNSLVSALGGFSLEDEGQYQLGDDALEVLRDLKRWIRFYDEKTNRMDVARCIFEANLVEGDLLPILMKWPESETENKIKSRLALACFEVLVPLTWPMERDRERMTVNHHRHLPVLELAQVAYKRAIINFDGARLLHSAVRAALPSISQPIGDRTARDQGIIKLVLYFLRNMSSITPSQNSRFDGDESQISRSATIDAFSYQDIFLFLLTIASNMGEEFRTEDVIVMEIIYHLVKRVKPEKLFMSEKQLHQAKASELSAMMNKESAMLKAYNRNGPTRHNRFGTMIWVKREGNKMSTLSGQDALTNASLRNTKIDNSKTFRPPRKKNNDERGERDLGPKPELNPRANDQLRSFVEDFLDSGFNPLFSHIRKTIDREAPHLMDYHRRQFFYLVAWFLDAERARRKAKKSEGKKAADEIGTFSLVAGVLNQETFITLNRALHESYDLKEWHELSAIMRCFTQILLIIQDMTASGNEDDEETAENILSRLFYEESTHDMVANIIRTYKDQGFDYLDAATELVHHFLRTLEVYSKQNADMQVRTRKRVRRKKKAEQRENGFGNEAEDEEGSDNDAESAQMTSKERKFDFNRFASKFTPQGVVDAFVTFTKYYQELTDTQLKRSHRYFYRIAFKAEMSVMLFRVDIVSLFYNMIQGNDALDKSCSVFKEWEELVKQILRKCTKKMEERPELVVEMLFSKLHGTATFLEHGYMTASSSSKGQPKPAAELEFKYTEELDRQIAIIVGILLNKNQTDHLTWIKKVLTDAELERRAWAAAEDARLSDQDPFEEETPAGDVGKGEPAIFTIIPGNQERRTAMLKNPHLRFLMTLCNFERSGPASLEDIDSVWVIQADVTADQLRDRLHYINQAEFSPVSFEDGSSAEAQLKRKTAPRKKAAFDDDDEGDENEDLLFEAGGPTNMTFIDDGEQSKKKKKKATKQRSRDEDDDGPSDSVLEERARKRKDREAEKLRKIKSALYINEGEDEFDSEEDEAFFAKERAIAAKARQAADSALASLKSSNGDMTKKRKSTVLLSSDEDEEDDDEDSITKVSLNLSGDQDSGTDDTRLSVANSEASARKRPRIASNAHVLSEDDVESNVVGGDKPLTVDSDEDEDMPVLTKRHRVRGGFVMDSDDE